MHSAEFVVIPVNDLPKVCVDGGVYHCDGRMILMNQDIDEYWAQARVMIAIARSLEVSGAEQ